MSDLFCFGCNYSGETHDERCPEHVDVERLVAQRDRLGAEVSSWKSRAEYEAAENERLRADLAAVRKTCDEAVAGWDEAFEEAAQIAEAHRHADSAQFETWELIADAIRARGSR